MIGGVAGYRPRVRTAYYERVYIHSPEGQLIYRGRWPLLQMLMCKKVTCGRLGGESIHSIRVLNAGIAAHDTLFAAEWVGNIRRGMEYRSFSLA